MATQSLTVADLPELPGYISVYRAAKIFGLSKASIFYKIYTQRAFRQVYRVGDFDEPGARPVLLMLESEVFAVKAAEDAAAAVVPFKTQLRAWHRRVKKWGTEHRDLFDGPINAAGQPHLHLQMLYLQHNPDDPAPTE